MQQMPPKICADMKRLVVQSASSTRNTNAKDTVRLKCAPDTGPRIVIIKYNIQPVAIALARSAMASLPCDKVSYITPLPAMLINSKAVPKNLAKAFMYIRSFQIGVVEKSTAL